VNSKEAFGVTIFQPAVATQKEKETNPHLAPPPFDRIYNVL